MIFDTAGFSRISPVFLCKFFLVHPSSFGIVSMRCRPGDSRSVLQIFHVELRENILFESRNSKTIMHQIVSDSAYACRPCDTSKFHKYRTQCLLPNKTDNMSIAHLNRSSKIRSIPRCPCRGEFSSNFHGMDCRRCPASDLLAVHLGEDDFRSDLSTHELVRVQLLALLIVIILGF